MCLADPLELGKRVPGSPPDVRAAQERRVAVDIPQQADVPIQNPVDHVDDPAGRVLLALGVREDVGHRVPGVGSSGGRGLL